MILIPHNRLTYGKEEELAVTRVVSSGNWVGGSQLAELERRLAAKVGVAHGIGVGSGLAALRLALHALGVGPSDIVAIPAYSCVALANAILACGAGVLPVEVQTGSWNICPAALQKAMESNPKIKTVIAVHTFGCPAQISELMALGLPVIEDCSHAFGNEMFGGVAQLGVISFHATKLLGAGEGGMVLTNDTAFATSVRDMRVYVDKTPSGMRLNEKMTDLEAAIALCQLDRLPSALARRTELARIYDNAFKPFARDRMCDLPVNPTGRVWYRYAVGVEAAKEVVAELARRGVAAARPVENWGGATEREPVAFSAYRRLVSLPLYPTLTREEQKTICSAFTTALQNLRAS